MDKDELEAREDTRLYPPRFVISVRRSCPAPDSRVVFRFKGATKQIVKEVILSKGMSHIVYWADAYSIMGKVGKMV